MALGQWSGSPKRKLVLGGVGGNLDKMLACHAMIFHCNAVRSLKMASVEISLDYVEIWSFTLTGTGCL